MRHLELVQEDLLQQVGRELQAELDKFPEQPWATAHVQINNESCRLTMRRGYNVIYLNRPCDRKMDVTSARLLDGAPRSLPVPTSRGHPPTAVCADINFFVTGTDFGTGAAHAAVSVNGKPCTIIKWTDTLVIAQLPARIPGTKLGLLAFEDGEAAFTLR